MTALDHFVASPFARAIGWTILHSLWQGGVVAALLAVTLLAVRSPRVRYVAACGALCLMVCGFAVTLTHFLPAAAQNPQSFKAPLLVWNLPGSTNTTGPWYANLAPAVPWIAPVWLCGVLLIYLHAFAGCLSAQQLRRRGVCAPKSCWLDELARLKRLLRVSRPVQLLESSLAEVPLVLGHFRPLILVPVGLLSGLPPSQIEAILLHELAHIRRHDYLFNVLQRLAEGLFFYHPAAWWASAVMRAERENCCDDIAVSVTGNAREYARALAALEQNRLAGYQPAIAATGGILVKRIHRLVYPNRANTGWTSLLAAAVLLTAGAISLAAWPSRGSAGNSPLGKNIQDAQEAAKMEKAAKDSQAATLERYAKWLNQDVVYIIDDAERAAFEKLSSNEEREKFIEQFWQRRNPDPSSSTNAFKEEHYKRIAFANKHFATPSGTPGWQTDRGHIYIVYGPPDEIDSAAPSSPKIEVWSYRHVEGVGEKVSVTFLDRTGHGDYHLAPGPSR